MALPPFVQHVDCGFRDVSEKLWLFQQKQLITDQWLDIVAQQATLFRAPLTQLVQVYSSCVIPGSFGNLVAAVEQSGEYWGLYAGTCDYFANLLALLEFCNGRNSSGGTNPGLAKSSLVYVLTRQETGKLLEQLT